MASSKELDLYFLEDAKDALKKIYKKYPTGGPMHIVLDDGNFDIPSIVFCLIYAVKQESAEEDVGLFERLAIDLLELPYNKRHKILAQQ